MATATAPKIENPKNLSDLNSAPTAEDALSNESLPSSDLGGEESKGKLEEEPVPKMLDIGDGVEVTDIQKKMKRAERFGMSVQLTEEEKRNTRAERFGTGSTVNGSDSSKKSEELKRKARAERFGTVQSASADEDAKKKARLARFGSISRPDSAEEDKKKARAIRFSSNSGSLKKGNDNEKIKEKTAIAGKAGAGT